MFEHFEYLHVDCMSVYSLRTHAEEFPGWEGMNFMPLGPKPPWNMCLQNKAGNGAGSGRHTTESHNTQSVLDRNDLDEFMAMVRNKNQGCSYSASP